MPVYVYYEPHRSLYEPTVVAVRSRLGEETFEEARSFATFCFNLLATLLLRAALAGIPQGPQKLEETSGVPLHLPYHS